MIECLLISLFSLSYAIKGGWIGNIFKNTKRVRNKNKLLDRILDGKIASTLLVFAGCYFMLPYNPFYFSIAWLLAVSPSIGEELGAVGRWRHAWGQYIEWMGYKQGREYGVKKAVQRGVFMGACMTCATGNVYFIYFSALFPLVHYIMHNIQYQITKKDSWSWAEWAVGFVCFGVPAVLF